jgi:hypothetical protein
MGCCATRVKGFKQARNVTRLAAFDAP